jgi:hypothetical protein
VPLSEDLLLCAKHLFVAAKSARLRDLIVEFQVADLQFAVLGCRRERRGAIEAV